MCLLLGSSSQQWTFLSFDVHVLAIWHPSAATTNHQFPMTVSSDLQLKIGSLTLLLALLYHLSTDHIQNTASNNSYIVVSYLFQLPYSSFHPSRHNIIKLYFKGPEQCL
jgi:hypothetical protein